VKIPIKSGLEVGSCGVNPALWTQKRRVSFKKEAGQFLKDVVQRGL
jgi:hypothetical protein